MAGQAFAAALRDAQLGRAEGFAVLYQRHQPALLRTLLGLAPDRAEQLAAETWHQVARDLTGYSGDEHGFRAWVITVGRLRLGGALRHVPNRPGPEPRATAADPGLPADPTTEALELVRTLPGPRAEAVLLRVVGGLDALTLADRTRSSHGDARARYSAGLATLGRHWIASHRDPDEAQPPIGIARLDPDRVDALLDDPSYQPAGPVEAAIADLIGALQAPAREFELAGAAVAIEAYETALLPTRNRRRRAARHAAVVAMAGIAVTLTTATAAAAASGSLPREIQEFAHTLVGAPEPPPVAVVAAPPAAAPSPSSVPGPPTTAAALPPMLSTAAQPRLTASEPVEATPTPAASTPTPSPSAAPSISTSPSPSAPAPAPSPSPSTASPTSTVTPTPAGASPDPTSDPLALCRTWQDAVVAGTTPAPELVTLLTALAGTPEQIQAYCDLTLSSMSPTPPPSPPAVPAGEPTVAAQASAPATGSSSEP